MRKVFFIIISAGLLFAAGDNNASRDIQAEVYKNGWEQNKRITDANLEAFENGIDLLCKDRIVSKKYGWKIHNDLFVTKEGFYIFPNQCVKYKK